MALSKIPKLYVSADNKIVTPKGYDRAYTIHEALTKIDLIDYVEVRIDSTINQSLLTDFGYVQLDYVTVEDHCENRNIPKVDVV